MPKTNLGLDIGTSSIKAVELIEKRNGYELRNLIKIDLPWMEKNAEKETITAKLIRDFIRKYKINTRRVISGIRGESVIIRRIRVPLMEEKQISQAMRWQVEEHIPYSLNQICLDFQVLEKNLTGEEGEEMSVILVGAKKETVEKHLRLLARTGVFPRIIDVDAFALFNVFQLSNSRDNDSVALLEIGHSTTSITLLDRGYPFLIRDINWGGSYLTEGIKKELRVSYQQAQQMKERYGIMGLDDEIGANKVKLANKSKEKANEKLVDRAIRKALDSPLGEIIHSFEYYTSEREGATIKKVILSGGTPCLKNIDKFFSEELGIPVKIVNPFVSITADPAKFQPEYLSRLRSIFAVGLGLALRRVKKI